MEKESIQDLIYRKLTSRKFHVTLIGYVSATLFFYWGLLPPELWVELVRYLFLIYVAGNVGEHATKSIEKSVRDSINDSTNSTGARPPRPQSN